MSVCQSVARGGWVGSGYPSLFVLRDSWRRERRVPGILRCEGTGSVSEQRWSDTVLESQGAIDGAALQLPVLPG